MVQAFSMFSVTGPALLSSETVAPDSMSRLAK
jgi:hypothetical protein